MKSLRRFSSLALLSATFLSAPAIAQSSASQDDVAALQAEIAALKQQISALSAKVDSAAAAAEKTAATTAAAEKKNPAPVTSWKGAPEVSSPSTGFSFKPRGRIQIDTASVSVPAAITTKSLGIGTEFRRIQVGADGTLPGGFGYRFEADFANSSVDLTDVYLTYKKGGTTVTVGQHKAFWGLEEMTSDLFNSFQERAAFNGAFGFERRLGLSVQHNVGDVLVQGGVFADNSADLNADTNNSYSIDGRVVFSPKIGKGQLHLAGSGHYRKLNDLPNNARYRARPFVRTTDVRLVDTGSFSSTGEHSFGLEASYNHGPFHATVEGHSLTSRRTGFTDPNFFGGYAEVGMFLTKGDTLGYKGGVYDRTKPAKPLNKGGIGAIQLNARYDYLDLVDAGIVGGRQSTMAASLIWTPIDYVRLIANYGHLELRDAAVPAGTSRDYSADVVGLRAQIDF
jgi:phosphate-selective porin OprO and OprP